MTVLPTLNIVSCLGGIMQTCGLTWDQQNFPWQDISNAGLELQWYQIHPQTQGTLDSKILLLNQAICSYTQYWTSRRQPFLVLGGDHSCAMGTWAGVLNALHSSEHFGLIWLDAHLDAHTFATSPSKKPHGMPIAALLGKADKRLNGLYPSEFFVQAEKLSLLGVRSYEVEEFNVLHQANVQIIFAEQMKSRRDFKHYLLAAIKKLSLSCQTIGISLDLDVIDPEDAPGVETPAAKGIKASHLLDALKIINQHPKVCGLEICEYSPLHDRDHKTLYLIGEIIASFFGDIRENKSLGFASSGIKSNSVPR